MPRMLRRNSNSLTYSGKYLALTLWNVPTTPRLKINQKPSIVFVWIAPPRGRTGGTGVDQEPAAELSVRPETVAFAGPGDEAEIYDFLVNLWKHNDNGWGWAYDPVTVLKQIEAATRPNPQTRSDPRDERRGMIGIIRNEEGKVVASVGLFIGPLVWFSTLPGLTELWCYVLPEARGTARHERDLFTFARWCHDSLKRDLKGWNAPFPLVSGFMHDGPCFAVMVRLWRRLFGGRQIGALFQRD